MYRKEYFPHNCLQTKRFYNQKCEPTDENRDLLASTSVPSQDPTTFWDRWSGWPILDLNSSMERSWRELSIDFGVIVSTFDTGKWCRVPCGDRGSFTQNWKLRDDTKSKSNLWCISLGKWYHPVSREALKSVPRPWTKKWPKPRNLHDSWGQKFSRGTPRFGIEPPKKTR